MERMLDIIIPHYTEPFEIGKPFFDMLCHQRRVDFDKIRVIIVHDGTDPFPDECFAGYPCLVEQHRIEHKGVSAARNYGMDLADAKWITFCDFDDTFTGVYSLKFLFDVLDNDDYDMMWGAFFVEDEKPGRKPAVGITDEFQLVWVHNRYYRLDFLRKTGERFSEDLWFSEDSAFNAVVNCQIKEGRIGEIKAPYPLYTWIWRKDSVTTDNAKRMHNLIGHFYRNKYVVGRFVEMGNPDAIPMMARTITDGYMSLTQNGVLDGHEELEKLLHDFLVEHRAELKTLPKEEWQKVMDASIREANKSGVIITNIVKFSDWLNQIKKG